MKKKLLLLIILFIPVFNSCENFMLSDIIGNDSVYYILGSEYNKNIQFPVMGRFANGITKFERLSRIKGFEFFPFYRIQKGNYELITGF